MLRWKSMSASTAVAARADLAVDALQRGLDRVELLDAAPFGGQRGDLAFKHLAQFDDL